MKNSHYFWQMYFWKLYWSGRDLKALVLQSSKIIILLSVLFRQHFYNCERGVELTSCWQCVLERPPGVELHTHLPLWSPRCWGTRRLSTFQPTCHQPGIRCSKHTSNRSKSHLCKTHGAASATCTRQVDVFICFISSMPEIQLPWAQPMIWAEEWNRGLYCISKP